MYSDAVFTDPQLGIPLFDFRKGGGA